MLYSVAKRLTPLYAVVVLFCAVDGAAENKDSFCRICFFNNKNADEYVCFEIKKGQSIFDIVATLLEKGVITNRFTFFILIVLKNARKKLKAGVYQIRKSPSQNELLEILIAGTAIVHKISIPEGVTAAVMRDIVNNHPCLHGPKVQNLAEGSVLPGTYFFPQEKTKREILVMMTEKLDALLDGLIAQYPLPVPLTKSEIVVLASIVEKETGEEREKPLIASVFFNRLKLGMRLQADPTVIYGITLGTRKMDRQLTREDWQIDSPFNTYKYKGLPPTPICCPGESTIRALFTASPSDQLFFVVSPSGGHCFSKKLHEHNRNVLKKGSLPNQTRRRPKKITRK
jgi:UPF0755 protein